MNMPGARAKRRRQGGIQGARNIKDQIVGTGGEGKSPGGRQVRRVLNVSKSADALLRHVEQERRRDVVHRLAVPDARVLRREGQQHVL